MATKPKERPLKWGTKFNSIPADAKDRAVHAALFTDYPKATVTRAEQMGYDYRVETLPNTYTPFRYALYTQRG